MLMGDQFSYLQDLFQVQPLHEPNFIDEALLQDLIAGSPIIEGGPSFFWLLNYFKREPAFVSSTVKELLGYHSAFLNNGGMSNLLRLIPAEDRRLLQKVYADIFSFYQRVPLEEKGLYRYDFNYRLQRADFRLISVMQQTLFLQTSPTGFPLIELSVVTDFSTYKSNAVVQLQIFKLQDGSYKSIAFNQYDESLDKLTEREKEVLGLISQGLTDKEIADQIGISLHTVKTHRKNVLTKTSSRNTAEAVNKYLAITAAGESY